MSPPTDTQQRIVDTARRLIHARSYADVGVAEICDQAGVKKSSFYHFFPSKRDLTLRVLDETYADVKHDLLDEAFRTDVSPLARLARFVEMTSRLQATMHKETGMIPGCPFGNIAAEQATQDDALRTRVGSIFERLEREFADVLAQARQANEVGEIDIRATATAMLSYLEGLLLMAKTRNDPAILPALLPAMLEIRISA